MWEGPVRPIRLRSGQDFRSGQALSVPINPFHRGTKAAPTLGGHRSAMSLPIESLLPSW